MRRGEPLTFLTNLRPGNALVGAELEQLLSGGDTLFGERLARDAEAILDRIDAIAQHGSERAEDVHRKADLALAVEGLREPLERFGDDAVTPAFGDEDPRPSTGHSSFRRSSCRSTVVRATTAASTR